MPASPILPDPPRVIVKNPGTAACLHLHFQVSQLDPEDADPGAFHVFYFFSKTA